MGLLVVQGGQPPVERSAVPTEGTGTSGMGGAPGG